MCKCTHMYFPLAPRENANRFLLKGLSCVNKNKFAISKAKTIIKKITMGKQPFLFIGTARASCKSGNFMQLCGLHCWCEQQFFGNFHTVFEYEGKSLEAIFRSFVLRSSACILLKSIFRSISCVIIFVEASVLLEVISMLSFQCCSIYFLVNWHRSTQISNKKNPCHETTIVVVTVAWNWQVYAVISLVNSFVTLCSGTVTLNFTLCLVCFSFFSIQNDTFSISLSNSFPVCALN